MSRVFFWRIFSRKIHAKCYCFTSVLLRFRPESRHKNDFPGGNLRGCGVQIQGVVQRLRPAPFTIARVTSWAESGKVNIDQTSRNPINLCLYSSPAHPRNEAAGLFLHGVVSLFDGVFFLQGTTGTWSCRPPPSSRSPTCCAGVPSSRFRLGSAKKWATRGA